MAEILLHILLGLCHSHSDILRQGEGGDPVNDAEVYRLCAAAHQGGNLFRRHTKDLRGRDGVDVLSGLESFDHRLILCNVCQQTQLDLGVVGIHQYLSGTGHKHLSQLRAKFRTHRDILQIGFHRTQPSGGGHGVLERSVDPSIRCNHLGQAVHIGGLELGQLTVLQDLFNNGMLSPQLFQHFGVCGVARLGLFDRRQPQPVEQQLTQLLG